MARHTAHMIWERGDQAFTDDRYQRRRVWRFDGGVEVPASASPLEILEMHHEAHGECFIAHSVRSDERCEPVVPAE